MAGAVGQAPAVKDREVFQLRAGRLPSAPPLPHFGEYTALKETSRRYR